MNLKKHIKKLLCALGFKKNIHNYKKLESIIIYKPTGFIIDDRITYYLNNLKIKLHLLQFILILSIYFIIQILRS